MSKCVQIIKLSQIIIVRQMVEVLQMVKLRQLSKCVELSNCVKLSNNQIAMHHLTTRTQSNGLEPITSTKWLTIPLFHHEQIEYGVHLVKFRLFKVSFFVPFFLVLCQFHTHDHSLLIPIDSFGSYSPFFTFTRSCLSYIQYYNI